MSGACGRSEPRARPLVRCQVSRTDTGGFAEGGVQPEARAGGGAAADTAMGRTWRGSRVSEEWG